MTLLYLVGFLAFAIALLLYIVRRYDRRFAVEERRRDGLPYDDLMKQSRLSVGYALAFVSGVGALFLWGLLHMALDVAVWAFIPLWAALFGLVMVQARRNR